MKTILNLKNAHILRNYALKHFYEPNLGFWRKKRLAALLMRRHWGIIRTSERTIQRVYAKKTICACEFVRGVSMFNNFPDDVD